MKKISIIAALAALTLGGVAQADVGIDARQANLSRQVDASKRSGKLSVRERNVLNTELRQIARTEAQLRARGNNLSERDERRLRVMLDRTQRHIQQLKNNRERGRSGIRL